MRSHKHICKMLRMHSISLSFSHKCYPKSYCYAVPQEARFIPLVLILSHMFVLASLFRVYRDPTDYSIIGSHMDFHSFHNSFLAAPCLSEVPYSAEASFIIHSYWSYHRGRNLLITLLYVLSLLGVDFHNSFTALSYF